EANRNPLLRSADISLQFSFPELRRAANAIIEKQVDMRQVYYDRNGIAVVHGQSRFLDANTVEVEQADGGRQRLRAKAFIIATGARPYHPPDVDFNHPRIFDSDKILSLGYTPQSITIYGAGVVGSEYTS